MANSTSNFEEKEYELIQIDTNEVHIIGDGPVALALAIKWRLMGKKVTLIGSHINEFTRGHAVLLNTWDKILEIIYPLQLFMPESGHVQLKDIERQLYQLAKALLVTMHKKVFLDFALNKKIIIADKGSTQEKMINPIELPVDFLIDCTGTSRAVLNAYNKKTETSHFEVVSTPIAGQCRFAKLRTIVSPNALPRTSHGEMFADTAFFARHNKIPYPLSYTLTIQALQRLGWNKYSLPTCYSRNSIKKNSNLIKSSLYVELPYTLHDETKKNEQIKKYAEILLKYYNNLSNEYKIELQKESIKYKNKPTISTFVSDIKCVMRSHAINDKDYPFIMHFGDTSANFPFASGKGLYFGIKWLKQRFKALQITEGSIIIDCQRLEKIYHKELRSYAKKLAKLNQTIIHKNSIKTNVQNIQKSYHEAFFLCKNNADRLSIKNSFSELFNRPTEKENENLVGNNKKRS